MRLLKKCILFTPVIIIFIIVLYGLYQLFGAEDSRLYQLMYKYGIISSEIALDVQARKLNEKNYKLVRKALYVLEDMGNDAIPVVPILIEMLKKRDKLFHDIFHTLDCIDSSWVFKDRDLFNFFIKTQLDLGSTHFFDAVKGLERMKNTSGQIISIKDINRLIDYITIDDNYHQKNAVFTLNKFVPGWQQTEKGRKALKKLFDNLKSKNTQIKRRSEKIIALIKQN